MSVHDWLCRVGNFLYQWQTLVAGLLALLGAIWTVRSIRKQIAQTDRLEKERQAREERAANAVLPMALSELVQYSLDCIKLLSPYVPAAGPPPQIPLDLTAPRIPDTILEPMQACARSADPDIAAQIQRLLRWTQIQHSRFGGLIQRAKQRQPPEVWEHEGIGAIMDAAELHARCGGLFPYARGRTPDPNLTFRQQLDSALFEAGIVVVDHPGLQAAIHRRQSFTFS